MHPTQTGLIGRSRNTCEDTSMSQQQHSGIEGAQVEDDFLLLNPGPVPVSEAVRTAMNEPMLSHRSPEFEAIYRSAQESLHHLFTQSTLSGRSTASDGTALLLNGTATMGMELAVANLVAPDDELVALVNGKFGRRFKRIAERYCSVTTVEIEWGSAFDLNEVAAAISDDTAVVTMVHNETSTGILNPVSGVGPIAREHDALFVVDCVTSLGGDVFCIDDWCVDIAITDAQKGLAAPPGISGMCVTPRAADRAVSDNAPFYQDLNWHLRKAADNQTPFTSAIPLIRALAVALEDIHEEGLSARIRRHRRQSAAVREGLRRLGFDLFSTPAGPSVYSHTVTAAALPPSVRKNSPTFFEAIRDRNASISGGQGHLDGLICRISNQGVLNDEDILRGIQTVGAVLPEMGVTVDSEAALAVAREQLRGEW